MGLGLQTGYGAEGAQVGLARLLAQREAAKRLQMDEQQQQQNEVYRNKALAQQEELKRLALEEAAKRGADLDAYRRESLGTRESIAKMYEEGRNARDTDRLNMQEALAKLRAEVQTYGINQATLRTLESIAGANARNALNFTKPRSLDVMGPDGQPVRVTRRYYPDNTYEDISEDKKPAGETSQTAAAKMDDLDRLINDIGNDWKESMTGGVQGRAGQVLRDAGSAPFWMGEEDKTKFDRLATNVARLKNELLQARSGVAVPKHEEIRTDREVPRLQDRDETFLTKLEATRRNIQEFKSRVRRLPQGGQPPAPMAPQASHGVNVVQSPNTPAPSQGIKVGKYTVREKR